MVSGNAPLVVDAETFRQMCGSLAQEALVVRSEHEDINVVIPRDKTTVANSSDGATAVQCVVHADLAAHPVELRQDVGQQHVDLA